MPPSPSSLSSGLLPLLPRLVLLLLLLADPRWLWWAWGCCEVEVVVEGAGCDAALPLRFPTPLPQPPPLVLLLRLGSVGDRRPLPPNTRRQTLLHAHPASPHRPRPYWRILCGLQHTQSIRQPMRYHHVSRP